MTIIGLYTYISRVQRCFYLLVVHPRATVCALECTLCPWAPQGCPVGQKPPGRSRRRVLALELPWVRTP